MPKKEPLEFYGYDNSAGIGLSSHIPSCEKMIQMLASARGEGFIEPITPATSLTTHFIIPTRKCVFSSNNQTPKPNMINYCGKCLLKLKSTTSLVEQHMDVDSL